MLAETSNPSKSSQIAFIYSLDSDPYGSGTLFYVSKIDHRDAMPKKKLMPLPHAAFHILLALADEDLHGYGIMRRVSDQTDEKLKLGPGTLYSSIHTLLEEGMIAESDAFSPSEPNAERRRYYRLTPTGRKLARAEASRLAEVLRAARRKDILRGDYV